MSYMCERFRGSNGEEPPRAVGLDGYYTTLYYLRFYLYCTTLSAAKIVQIVQRSVDFWEY